MRLIIDIDEDYVKIINKNGASNYPEEVIKNGIPLDEQEPKTGHWIYDEILDKHYYCSECKSMGVDYWDYCPSCGAKMVEPQRSEKWVNLAKELIPIMDEEGGD